MIKSIIPIKVVEKILRDSGEDVRVSESATVALRTVLEDYGHKISVKALEYARHAKRTTIKEEDIRLALEQKNIGSDKI